MQLDLTIEAEADLLSLYIQGIERFGIEQADAYRASLESKFIMLTQHTEMGPIWEESLGIRKFPHLPYVILYQPSGELLRIIRVVDGRSGFF